MSGGSSSSNTPSVKGVELHIICGGIPVVTLDKACVFHEHVSWMLQSALAEADKADSLYEYIEDKKLVAEARKLGLSADELGIVRLKSDEFRHVKAVGTTGKRSIMLAVVVALALEDPDNCMEDLWKELRQYKLGKAFVRLLESGLQTVNDGTPVGNGRHDDHNEGQRESFKDVRKDNYKDNYWDNWEWNDSGDWSKGSSSSGARAGRDREDRENRRRADASPARPPVGENGGRDGRRDALQAPAGTEVNVICGNIPVLDMDKTSVFHENVSWLLQTAMESTGKADSLFEFCNDRDVMSVCKRELQLTDQDMGLVSLKRSDLSHIKAIGTSGKRSIVMAVVVALVIHNEVQCEDLQKEVWEYDKKLFKPLDQLIRATKAQCTPARISGGGHGRSRRSQSRSRSPPPSSKRKSADDNEEDDWGAWDGPKAKRSTSEGRGRSGKSTDLGNGALEMELDKYIELRKDRRRK